MPPVAAPVHHPRAHCLRLWNSLCPFSSFLPNNTGRWAFSPLCGLSSKGKRSAPVISYLYLDSVVNRIPCCARKKKGWPSKQASIPECEGELLFGYPFQPGRRQGYRASGNSLASVGMEEPRMRLSSYALLGVSKHV